MVRSSVPCFFAIVPVIVQGFSVPRSIRLHTVRPELLPSGRHTQLNCGSSISAAVENFSVVVVVVRCLLLRSRACLLSVPSPFVWRRSASTVTGISHGQDFHRAPRFAPYLFHNVSGGRLKRGGDGSTAAKSLSNPVEVEYISSLLQ